MAINLLARGGQKPLDSTALLKGPERSSLEGVNRNFAGVHNLQQNDGFRNAFHRVQPSPKQIKDYVGKDLNKIATFASDNGIQIAKLQVSKKNPDGFISARQAEKDFRKVQAGYESLHRELQNMAPPAGQQQKGFLSAIKNLFRRNPERATLTFNAQREDAPPAVANPGQAPDSAQPGTGAKPNGAVPPAPAGKIHLTITSGDDHELVNKAGQPVTFTAQDKALYQDKVGWRKTAWLTGAGLGLAAAAAVAITVPVLGWIVGGALAGGILLKAAFGKSPWWGKTVEGQLQKSARQQARQAADSIAEMVKKQVLCDPRDTNIAGPAGGYQKQDVLTDANMLTDFVALARQDSPKALYKRVKEFVLSGQSPLPEEVRKLAGQSALERGVKWLWPGNWFQGDPKAHARKTVEMMTQEITRGIMQGVQEGVLQSAVLDLSNDLNREARAVLYETPMERFKLFQEAVAKLFPSGNESRHQIHKADLALSDLKRFQNGTTQSLLAHLKSNAAKIGQENLLSYGDLLRQLDGDVSTHIASLEQIESLLGKPEGSHPIPPANLAKVEEELALIAGGTLNAQEIDAAKAKIDGGIKTLRERIQSAGDPGTDKLVESHAQQFLRLLDAMDRAAGASVGPAKQLAHIRAEFSQPEQAPTMAMVRSHQAALKTLIENGAGGLENPTENQAITNAYANGNSEAARLEMLCAGLAKAASAQEEIDKAMQSGLELARAGDLNKALDPSGALRIIDDRRFVQKQFLEEWAGAGLIQPSDLKRYEDKDVEAFRSQACALAIGLDTDQAKGLEPILLALSQGDQNDLIKGLRAELTRDRNTVLGSLRELQDLLASKADTPTQSEEKALKSLKALIDKRLFNGNPLTCQEAVQSLHSSNNELLNSYRLVHQAKQDLQALLTSDLGEKLYKWGESQGQIAPNSRENQGFDPKLTLQLLHAFGEQSKGLSPDTKNDLKAIAQAWPDGQVDRWSLEPDRLKALGLNQLSKVAALVSTVSRDFARHVRQEELQARALAQYQAGKIAKGGTSSKDALVKAGVMQGSSAKDPGQVQQLQQDAKDLRMLQLEQRDVERQQRLDTEQISKLSSFLKDKLGYRGEARALARKIADNPELRAEFMMLIDTGVRLAGAEAPPLLQATFTQQELLAGAQELATYVPHRNLTSLPEELRPMVEQRNAMIAKLKAAASPEGRTKLVNKDPQVRAYIESYLNEGYAYQLLARNVKLDRSGKEVRIILDNTAEPAELDQSFVDLTRKSTLTDANLKAIQDGLIHGLARQEGALRVLMDEAQQHYGSAMSSYMQEQQQLLTEQKQAAERLPMAYRNPQTGDLAQVGQLLRQADGLKDKTEIQIQRAYIKGQNQASQHALKYFDIRRFDARRPGFLGRLIFSLMRRGQPLRRLLRSAADQKNALGRAIEDLARAIESQKIGQDQREMFAQGIANLQQAKNALVKDEGKVRAALMMLAAEHLAGKQGNKPQITEADLNTILDQWKSMLAGASRDCFPEIEEEAKSLLNKTAEDLEQRLDAKDKGELALELSNLMRQQDALVAEHQELRAELNKIDLETTKPPENLARLYKAGLDKSDQETVESLEIALKNLGDGQPVDLLKGWGEAGSLLAKDPASALHRAGRELRILENRIERAGQLSLENQTQLRLLKDQLEDAFLARMGPSAPLRLERSADSAQAVKLAKDVAQLKSVIDGFGEGKHLEAWIATASAAKGPSIEKFLTDLQTLDLALRDQLIGHPVDQLAAAQAPRSLTALAHLANARLDIGLIYGRLSAAKSSFHSDLYAHVDITDKQAMRGKADSHLYGGLFMQQELRNKNNAWSPDPSVTIINGLPAAEPKIQDLRRMCEQASVQIPKGALLTASQADALDHAAEGRLDMGMMQSQVDDSMDPFDDEDGFVRNRAMFNAVMERS